MFILLIVFIKLQLECGSDFMFSAGNLNRLHLTLPAELISNYRGSLQILSLPQTQNGPTSFRLVLLSVSREAFYACNLSNSSSRFFVSSGSLHNSDSTKHLF